MEGRTRISLAELQIVLAELSGEELFSVLTLEQLRGACIAAAADESQEDAFEVFWDDVVAEVQTAQYERYAAKEEESLAAKMQAAADSLGIKNTLTQLDSGSGWDMTTYGSSPKTSRLYELGEGRKPHLVRWRRGRFIRICSGFQIRRNRNSGGEPRKGSRLVLLRDTPGNLCRNCYKVTHRACGEP